MRYWAGLVVVGVLSSLVTAGTQEGCTWKTKTTSGQSIKYDMSAMTHPSGEADYLSISDSSNTFYINICGNSSKPCSPLNSVCQIGTTGSKYYGCGTLASQLFYDPATGGESGVMINYSGGTVGCTPSVARSTTITLTCDATQGRGKVTAVKESACYYELCFRFLVFPVITHPLQVNWKPIRMLR
ncbi:hypothetical protein Pelo_985 [Pelomyxa schiedti]|nr:hypothetical protein Pelo_985 [Pelomyxa schiedti]